MIFAVVRYLTGNAVVRRYQTAVSQHMFQNISLATFFASTSFVNNIPVLGNREGRNREVVSNLLQWKLWLWLASEYGQ